MNNPLRILNLKALPAVAMAALAFAAAGASAQSSEVLTLDIKAQKSGSALVMLAKTSGVQIMLAEEVGANVEVEGLKGEYRFEDALAALLTDTGLTYKYASENLVVVRQAQEEEEDSEEPAAADENEPIELASADGDRFAASQGARPVGGSSNYAHE